jgi:hypothetical protein
MIPVLIVPVLNRYDLLDQMLDSIDCPVQQVVIIDNGCGYFAGGRDAHIVNLPHNIGVAAAWNLGMKVTPWADWWFIVNSDITFGEGDLARLAERVNPGEAEIYYMHGMSAFALTRHALADVGWFDENFHPAYDEDIDWQRRARILGINEVNLGLTGSGGHVGSATIMSDPQLRARNGITHAANDAYYVRKWGGRKSGGEQFMLPFDRGSHVGEWRLEPERLREQAWPRPARQE